MKSFIAWVYEVLLQKAVPNICLGIVVKDHSVCYKLMKSNTYQVFTDKIRIFLCIFCKYRFISFLYINFSAMSMYFKVIFFRRAILLDVGVIHKVPTLRFRSFNSPHPTCTWTYTFNLHLLSSSSSARI